MMKYDLFYNQLDLEIQRVLKDSQGLWVKFIYMLSDDPIVRREMAKRLNAMGYSWEKCRTFWGYAVEITVPTANDDIYFSYEVTEQWPFVRGYDRN